MLACQPASQSGKKGETLDVTVFGSGRKTQSPRPVILGIQSHGLSSASPIRMYCSATCTCSWMLTNGGGAENGSPPNTGQIVIHSHWHGSEWLVLKTDWVTGHNRVYIRVIWEISEIQTLWTDRVPFLEQPQVALLHQGGLAFRGDVALTGKPAVVLDLSKATKRRP